MSVKMIVDIIRKNETDFSAENPMIPQGSLAFDIEGPRGIGDRYVSGIKLGDGVVKWNELPYLEIPNDIAKKWHVFAENSGTNSRLVTLPDFNIAYANFDVSNAETEELLKNIRSNIDYVDGNLIFSGEQTDIGITISNTDGSTINSIQLGKSSLPADNKIFVLADTQARQNINELWTEIDKIKPNNSNQEGNEPQKPLIEQLPIFGSFDQAEEGAEPKRITKGVVQWNEEDESGDYVFINSFGEWKNFKPESTITGENDDKPASVELVKTIQASKEKTRIKYLEIATDDDGIVSCQQTENMPYYGNATVNYEEEGEKINFVLEVEEIPVNSGPFAFSLERFIDSKDEGKSKSWKDNFKPVSSNNQDVFITFKKKYNSEEEQEEPKKQEERKILYCEKNGAFLKNYWPDIGIVSAEYAGESVNLVKIVGYQADKNIVDNSGDYTLITLVAEEVFETNGAEILIPSNNAKNIIECIENKERVKIQIINIEEDATTIIIMNEKELINPNYLHWKNNSTYQKLTIRKAQDGIGDGVEQIEFDKPGVIDIDTSVPNYYAGAPYFINYMNAFGENNPGGEQIDFGKVKMITCYPNYDFTEEKATIQNQMKAYSCLLYGIYYQNSALQLYFSEKPTSNINIVLKLEEF